MDRREHGEPKKIKIKKQNKTKGQSDKEANSRLDKRAGLKEQIVSDRPVDPADSKQ